MRKSFSVKIDLTTDSGSQSRSIAVAVPEWARTVSIYTLNGEWGSGSPANAIVEGCRLPAAPGGDAGWEDEFGITIGGPGPNDDEDVRYVNFVRMRTDTAHASASNSAEFIFTFSDMEPLAP